MMKTHGITIVHKCTSARHALSAEKHGCDIISIDGFECAGHPGEDDVPGLILIPAPKDKVKIPLLASGGIGDARGFVAALALGAEGINMGTRFWATKEAPIHDNVKAKYVENDELGTNLIFRKFHNSARVGKNEVSDEVVAISAREDAVFEDAQAAAVLMGMNTVYYRFRHLVGKDAYSQKAARLRMTYMARPKTNKATYELMSLAIAALAGCEMCIKNHEASILQHGLGEDHVHDAVRIAAILQGAAVALSL